MFLWSLEAENKATMAISVLGKAPVSSVWIEGDGVLRSLVLGS